VLKHFDFECQSCELTFDAYVEGADGTPEECPRCLVSSSKFFKKLPSSWASPTTIIVDYPGSKRHKAGYMHLYNRPAEKKGSQVSMYTPTKRS
jgi:rubredoxin